MGCAGDNSLLAIDEDMHRNRRRLCQRQPDAGVIATPSRVKPARWPRSPANIARWPVGNSFAAAPKMSEIARGVIFQTAIGATDPAS